MLLVRVPQRLKRPFEEPQSHERREHGDQGARCVSLERKLHVSSVHLSVFEHRLERLFKRRAYQSFWVHEDVGARLRGI